MKKLLVLIAVGLLVLGGCTPKEPEPTIYKIGTASYTSVSPRAYNADTGTDGRIQVNTYFATVALDKDGKFVYVFIDTAQNQGTFDAEGQIVAATNIPTKKERGDAYGMKVRSEIGKEWYEQIAALEEWMIGKTPAEVKAVPTKVVDDAHQFVPDTPDLNTSVTITIEGYLKVVEKAVANAVEVENVSKVGAGSYTKVAGRNFNTDTGVEGRVQVNVTFAGVALDADGNVVYVHIDTAQNQGTFDGEGMIVAAEAIPTKKERGDAYGMKVRSEIGKEWYEQIAALEEWMIGKTVTAIKAVPVKVVDDAHQNVPDTPDLNTSVTITIEAYLGATDTAAKNAIAIP